MPHLDPSDTIAAISSPPGSALRGLVRLSGPEAWSIALDRFEPEDPAQPPPTRPEWRSGRLSVEGLRRPLGVRIALWPGSRTYTGQPMAEIHTPGARPLVQLVLADRLARGARLAEPGEFTLLAFLNNRLDLTRAEAVLRVIEAQTPEQLDSALRQLAGGLFQPTVRLRDQILDTLALLEAGLDFADEPDVEALDRSALAQSLDAASTDLNALADRLRHRHRSDERPKVVLLGPPNAGKSQLFNALIGLDRALVSSTAGTTRDYLSSPCVCDGLEFDLIDTAGIEPSASAITVQAQTFRSGQSARADLILWCRSADTLDESAPTPPDRPVLHLWTKADTAPAPSPDLLSTSSQTGQGLDALKTAIASALRARLSDTDAPASTASRCRESLRRASESLHQAASTLQAGFGDEFVALDLRNALDDLGSIVGETVTDDLLDRIFGRFCIGK
ncbi:MAG TPA: tRNA modification GTPase [Isosphaeraceae bacterium]|nr:tRNA modification GTPase [Isosphaeraceae bacterium]